jgi:hypothetical protein
MRTANIPAGLRERIDAIKATLAERFIEGGAGTAYRPLPDGTREMVPMQEMQHPPASWSFPQRPTVPPKRAPVPTARSVRAPRKSEIAARKPKPKPRPAPKVSAEPDAPICAAVIYRFTQGRSLSQQAADAGLHAPVLSAALHREMAKDEALRRVYERLLVCGCGAPKQPEADVCGRCRRKALADDFDL